MVRDLEARCEQDTVELGRFVADLLCVVVETAMLCFGFAFAFGEERSGAEGCFRRRIDTCL